MIYFSGSAAVQLAVALAAALAGAAVAGGGATAPGMPMRLAMPAARHDVALVTRQKIDSPWLSAAPRATSLA